MAASYKLIPGPKSREGSLGRYMDGDKRPAHGARVVCRGAVPARDGFEASEARAAVFQRSTQSPTPRKQRQNQKGKRGG
jgi:hypothetical protein